MKYYDAQTFIRYVNFYKFIFQRWETTGLNINPFSKEIDFVTLEFEWQLENRLKI